MIGEYGIQKKFVEHSLKNFSEEIQLFKIIGSLLEIFGAFYVYALIAGAMSADFLVLILLSFLFVFANNWHLKPTCFTHPSVPLYRNSLPQLYQ